MGCEPKFVSGFSFGCVLELITDIRSGTITVETVKKGLWIVGNALDGFSPSNPAGPFGEAEYDSMSVAELCDTLEVKLAAGAPEPVAIDPATLLMIAQLVWKIFQAWKK